MVAKYRHEDRCNPDHKGIGTLRGDEINRQDKPMRSLKVVRYGDPLRPDPVPEIFQPEIKMLTRYSTGHWWWPQKVNDEFFNVSVLPE